LKPKIVAVCLLLLFSLSIVENSVSEAPASTIDLNALMFSKWQQWDALLTRWMDTNGTLVDLYDYSRRGNGDPSNLTLSAIAMYQLALLAMYEGTSNTYYLSKLRTIIDGAITNSLFYRTIGGLGEIFYPPGYYFNGGERDNSAMGPAWYGYIATKLWVITGNSSYKQLADRIAHESYVHFRVENATDMAWMTGYYAPYPVSWANADKTVNRLADMTFFYAYYGKMVNSTYSSAISKMLHWQVKAQLVSGGFAYTIGQTTEAYFYTAKIVFDWLKAYEIDNTLFSSYLTNIQSAITWLHAQTYNWGYSELVGSCGALILGYRNGFTVPLNKLQTRTYVTLQLLNFTEYGVLYQMSQSPFGWRWAQFGFGMLFGAYPLPESSFVTSDTETLIDVPNSGNNRLITKQLSFGDFIYAIRLNDNYGSGHYYYRSPLPVTYVTLGRTQGMPVSSVTKTNYYLDVVHNWSGTNIAQEHIYASGLVVSDILAGSRRFGVHVEQTYSPWKIRVENGTSYDMWQLNGVYKLSESFVLQHNSSSTADLYVYCPSTSWTFWKTTGFNEMYTTLTQGQRALTESIFAPFIGGLNPMTVLHTFTTLLNYKTETMPLSFEQMVNIYVALKEKFGELRWGNVSWKSMYQSCLDSAQVKLTMHNKPQQVSITAWSYVSHKLTLTVLGSVGTTSTTKVYCAHKGKPKEILIDEVKAIEGMDWTYSVSTKILQINATHSSQVNITIIYLQGDINGDGVVDIHDLCAIGKAYGASKGDVRYDPDMDLNNDTIIDVNDLAIYDKNYGERS